MSVEWIRTVAPTGEPLSLDEAKAQLILHQEDDNALVQDCVRAARDAAEDYLGHGLLTQTWQATFPRFFDVMWLPMAWPLQNDALANPSTAPVVKYYDTAGTLQTLATTDYLVDTVSRPGRILRAPSKSWPSLQGDRLMGVEITYVVGWTSAASVPPLIKAGLKVILTGLEGQRGDPTSAQKAAEACWSLVGRVRWIHPECSYGVG
jgi:uncharacterized phiE125 gp8 family phage protein